MNVSIQPRLSRRPRVANRRRVWCGFGLVFAFAMAGAGGIAAAATATPVPRPALERKPATPATPAPEPVSTAASTNVTCGNLVYAGTQTSVCFADRFLGMVSRETSLRVEPRFVPVRLDAPEVFNHPFCVWSGNESFSLAKPERDQLRSYLLNGGFLLVSPGCSDKNWDKSLRNELKLALPDHPLKALPMTHPVFSVVNQIPRLADKNGRSVKLEGIEVNGRLVLVYSPEGLNDVANAKGCCCCGGNEVADPVRVNVNVLTYALLY